MICERSVSFLTFPRATKEVRHSAFNKTEFFFFCVGMKSFLVYCVRRRTDIFRFILIYFIIASYVPQGGKNTPSFEQTAETGMLSNAGEEEKVVETVLPVKAAKEEVVADPEDKTKVEDNSYVGESRSVITR